MPQNAKKNEVFQVVNRLPPSQRKSRGANVLMLLILLVLVGGGLVWAFSESPPDTPLPSATGAPATVP